jgi:hypothetical protein
MILTSRPTRDYQSTKTDRPSLLHAYRVYTVFQLILLLEIRVSSLSLPLMDSLPKPLTSPYASSYFVK